MSRQDGGEAQQRTGLTNKKANTCSFKACKKITHCLFLNKSDHHTRNWSSIKAGSRAPRRRNGDGTQEAQEAQKVSFSCAFLCLLCSVPLFPLRKKLESFGVNPTFIGESV